MDRIYAEIGVEVVICFSGKYQYRDEYKHLMYTRGTIIQICGTHGCITAPGFQKDDETLLWPIDDMILASDIDLLTPEQKAKIR